MVGGAREVRMRPLPADPKNQVIIFLKLRQPVVINGIVHPAVLAFRVKVEELLIGFDRFVDISHLLVSARHDILVKRKIQEYNVEEHNGQANPAHDGFEFLIHEGDLYNPGGFGLGFWVTEQLGRNGQPGSVDSFGWAGAYRTTYWVDPVEKLVAVLMTQLIPAGNSDLHTEFRAMVYQSIVDSYERR
jgi:hypothetical protein